VRKFIQTIGGSVYSPEFYRGLLEKPFSESLKYFIYLCLLLAFVSTIWVSVDAIPAFKNFSETTLNSVTTSFPDDLVITIKDGKVASNRPGPIFINPIKNFFVLDTENDFTLERYKSYNAAFWLTKEGIVARDRSGKIQIVSLDKVADMRIDKAFVTGTVQKFQPYVSAIAAFLPVLIFIGMFFYFILTLFNLLFGSFIVWIIAKWKNIDIGYKKSYQIALHAVTLPLVISLISFGAAYWYITGILLAAVSWLNLKQVS
jgi:hypothetical protein